MYNPQSPYVVYCEDCYRSDTWDPYAYGVVYDQNRPFFEQLGELLKRVPKMALFSDRTRPSVNSPYINYSGANKNSYLIFNGGDSENSMYSRGARFFKDTADIYFGQKLERCYEGVNVVQSAGVHFSKNVSGCVDCSFLIDASGAQNCFGCVNIRHATNCFLNEQLDKEAYQAQVEKICGSYQATEDFKKKFADFSLKFPRRENSNLKTVNCTGDYLFESKNLTHCFEATNCEDCKYGFFVKGAKSSYDFTGFGYNAELLLECVGVGMSQRVIGSCWIEDSHDVEYSFCVAGSEYCLGCDGIRHGQYSILNKKYPKEKFEEIRDLIVAELKRSDSFGSFMPLPLAFFAYNETIAQDNMPLAKEEALKRGFRWEENLQMTKGKETVKPEDIPDHIRDVPDSLTKEVLACVTCGRNYQITVQELSLYRREVVPIPRKCFYCRHQERIGVRGELRLYDRTCVRCHKTIKTTYAPERPEIVYCEQCYNAEVV
jgi:hypothetical protein